MEVLKYARDDFLTFCMAIDVPEVNFGLFKNRHRNKHINNELWRQILELLLAVESALRTL